MKSRQKVISQKHIKEIPVGMFNMRHIGLLQHGTENIQDSQAKKRQKRQHKMIHKSRSINRSSK